MPEPRPIAPAALTPVWHRPPSAGMRRRLIATAVSTCGLARRGHADCRRRFAADLAGAGRRRSSCVRTARHRAEPRDGSFLLANLADGGGRLAAEPRRRIGAVSDGDGGRPTATCELRHGGPPAANVDLGEHAASGRGSRRGSQDIADGFVVGRRSKRRPGCRRGPALYERSAARPERDVAVRRRDVRAASDPLSGSAPTGDLSAPEPVVTFGRGTFPDGFAFDRDGRIWITSLISNRLLLPR